MDEDFLDFLLANDDEDILFSSAQVARVPLQNAENCQPSRFIRCTVPACSSAQFTRPTAIRRHWQLKHCRTVHKFCCIVEGCKFQNVREDKVREHCHHAHFDAFADDKDREIQLKNLCHIIVPNDANNFIDPCGLSPPGRAGKVSYPVIPPMARVTKIPQIHSQRLKRNHSPDGDSATKRFNPALPGDVRNMRPLPTDKSGLFMEFNKMQHIVSVCQARANEAKKSLKALELQELKQKDERIKELEKQLQEQRDLLRTRDRQIRHLELEKGK